MSCSAQILLPAVLVALPLSTATQSHVWVVSSPTPASAIQGAVNAATDGDTVLVKGSGTYDPILIQSKALTVLADQGMDVRVNVTVRDLTSSQRVDLRGLRFLPKPVGFVELAPPLVLSNNQGLVWVEECEAAGGTALGRSIPGISVDRCADVVLMRTRSEGWTSFDGSSGHGSQEGHGLSVGGGSRIVAYDCLFQGADGYVDVVVTSPRVGGAGVLSRSLGDKLFLGACQAIGGDGVAYEYDTFIYYCSDGGPGLQSAGPTRVFDSHAQGGLGAFSPFGRCSSDGPDQTGNVLSLQGQGLRFSVSAPVREGQPFQLDFTGPPNTPIWLLLGPRPANRFQATGPLVIEQPSASPRGVTDASGELQVTQTMPSMAPGIQFGRLFLQAFYLDARGRFVLGGASMFMALDASL